MKVREKHKLFQQLHEKTKWLTLLITIYIITTNNNESGVSGVTQETDFLRTNESI